MQEQQVHGGARKGSGRKSKLVSMEAQLEWKAQLKRAITSAQPNLGCIKKDSFWTLREVKERWGIRAVNEFKEWFEAQKHFDQLYADQLLQERMAGTLSAEKYQALLYKKAFSWGWSLKPERRQEAWELTRGLRTLH